MRDDPFWAYGAGGWRRARRPFRCMHWRGSEQGQCPNPIGRGDEYYDTGDGTGSHFFATVRICRECAESIRARTRRVS